MLIVICIDRTLYKDSEGLESWCVLNPFACSELFSFWEEWASFLKQ